VEGSRVTYTIRLRSALHRKAHGQLALYSSDACRSLLMCALGHDRCTRLRPDNGVLRCTTKNQACGVGQNLDYDGVSSFSIAITALRHHYFVLSCQPTSPEAL
jgi:hypothetical protein